MKSVSFIEDCLLTFKSSLPSYFPGHLHAFYLEWVYYDRREQAREGRFTASRAPGIYSDKVQAGGNGYGTVVQPGTH